MPRIYPREWSIQRKLVKMEQARRGDSRPRLLFSAFGFGYSLLRNELRSFWFRRLQVMRIGRRRSFGRGWRIGNRGCRREGRAFLDAQIAVARAQLDLRLPGTDAPSHCFVFIAAYRQAIFRHNVAIVRVAVHRC